MNKIVITDFLIDQQSCLLGSNTKMVVMLSLYLRRFVGPTIFVVDIHLGHLADYYVKYTLMPGDCECMDLAISFTYMHAAIPALVWLQLTFTSIKVALAAKFLLSVGFGDRKQPHQPSQLCCVLIYRKGFYVIGSGIQQAFISPSIWSSMHLSK